MKISRHLFLPFALQLAVIPSLAAADTPFSATAYAGSDGVLSWKEAVVYAFLLKHEDLREAHANGFIKLDTSNPPTEVTDTLDDFRSATKHEAPWTAAELDKLYKEPDEKEQDAATPAWRKIDGFTKKKEVKSGNVVQSFGPIQLRKDADQLNLKSGGIGDVKGATLGFANNYDKKGSGAWNSEGVLYYPYTNITQLGIGSSSELLVGPSVEWKLAETEDATGKDVQSLTLGIPIIDYFTPGSGAGRRVQHGIWVFQGKPYYQTDFSFEHSIIGGGLSAEFVGSPFGNNFIIGDYQDTGVKNMQYRLRVMPKVDYSDVLDSGPHTTRAEDDDWFRAGGLISFDLRIGGATVNPLVLGVSYSGLDTISGDDGYSKMFKANATWWLSDYAGLTLEYSNGETPVASEDVDMLTLGLDLRY